MNLDNSPKGVYKETDRKYKRYVAAWSENGKLKRKTFSINKYGNDKAFELACEYRDKMAKEFGIYNT